MYIYMYVCVCVCIWITSRNSFHENSSLKALSPCPLIHPLPFQGQVGKGRGRETVRKQNI